MVTISQQPRITPWSPPPRPQATKHDASPQTARPPPTPNSCDQPAVKPRSASSQSPRRSMPGHNSHISQRRPVTYPGRPVIYLSQTAQAGNRAPQLRRADEVVLRSAGLYQGWGVQQIAYGRSGWRLGAIPDPELQLRPLPASRSTAKLSLPPSQQFQIRAECDTVVSSLSPARAAAASSDTRHHLPFPQKDLLRQRLPPGKADQAQRARPGSAGRLPSPAITQRNLIPLPA